MKTSAIIFSVVLLLLSTLLLAETCDMRIDSIRVDADSCKFELLIRRTDAWDVGLGKIGMLGQCDWYFDFNAAAFGANEPFYDSLNATIKANNLDVLDYTFSVQVNVPQLQVKCVLEGTANQGYDPPLDTWDTLLTVIWLIDDTGENSGITWDEINTGMQDADLEEVTITYEGNGDISLPVTMTNISATASRENGVSVLWEVESEVSCAGFHIWRSESDKSEFKRITTQLIPGRGNASSSKEYVYNDKNVLDNVVYWYKIEEISTEGVSSFFGPMSVIGVSPIPNEFRLTQNYPNPFNPNTQFDYQLPEDSNVQISVYDILGKRVKVLLDEDMKAGYHHMSWDGTTENGRPVASGVYLIQISTLKDHLVRKVSLMR
ncbi:T9SS type A sorting domain-containing protein [candidate division KSB1 bacterium]|nr:T9SS type A sorting domain-containing protein [candidate division KSB1 bacterium]